MMFVKMLAGVKDHFRSRFWEWMMCAMLAWAGYVTANSETEFLYASTFRVMRSMARQDFWGVAFIVVASLRAIVLFLNGTFVPFRRYSPLVRSALAGLSGFAWAFIAMGLWQGDSIYIGSVTYFGLMIGDFFLLSEIAEEAGEAEREYRDGSARDL